MRKKLRSLQEAWDVITNAELKQSIDQMRKWQIFALLVHSYNLRNNLVCINSKGAMRDPVRRQLRDEEESKEVGQQPESDVVQMHLSLPKEWLQQNPVEFNYVYASSWDEACDYELHFVIKPKGLLSENRLSITVNVKRSKRLAEPLASRRKQTYSLSVDLSVASLQASDLPSINDWLLNHATMKEYLSTIHQKIVKRDEPFAPDSQISQDLFAAQRTQSSGLQVGQSSIGVRVGGGGQNSGAFFPGSNPMFSTSSSQRPHIIGDPTLPGDHNPTFVGSGGSRPFGGNPDLLGGVRPSGGNSGLFGGGGGLSGNQVGPNSDIFRMRHNQQNPDDLPQGFMGPNGFQFSPMDRNDLDPGLPGFDMPGMPGGNLRRPNNNGFGGGGPFGGGSFM